MNVTGRSLQASGRLEQPSQRVAMRCAAASTPNSQTYPTMKSRFCFAFAELSFVVCGLLLFFRPFDAWSQTNASAGLPANQDQCLPAVASDGVNFFAVWLDRRNHAGAAWTDCDVYGTRITASGEVLDPNGRLIATNAFWSSQLALGFDGTNYLVAWLENQAEVFGSIRGTRIATDGTVLDGLHGFAIGAPTGLLQSDPAMAFNGKVWLVAWNDWRNQTNGIPDNLICDVYGARVTPGGVVLEPQNIPICRAPMWQTEPAVAAIGEDFLVVWRDSSSIDGARVTAAGEVSPSYVVSSGLVGQPNSPALATLGTNYLAAWDESFNDGTGVVHEWVSASRLAANGSPMNGAGFLVRTNLGLNHSVALTAAGTNWFVVWQDGQSYFTNNGVWGARVNANSEVSAAIPISTLPTEQSQPAIACNGSVLLALWRDARNADPAAPSHLRFADIYGALLDLNGNVQQANGFLVSSRTLETPNISWPAPADIVYGTPLTAVQLNATASVPGTFTYHPSWWTYLSAGSNQVLSVTFQPFDRANFLPATASVTIKVQPAALSIKPDDQFKVQGAPNPVFTATYTGLVAGDTPDDLDTLPAFTTTATTDSPPGAYPIVVSGAFDPNYTITYLTGTLTILPKPWPSAPGDQVLPAVTASSNLYLVTWADQRRGSNEWDIFAARVSPAGHVLDPGGILVCTDVLGPPAPAAASDGQDFLVVWHDAKDNNPAHTDVFGARVNAHGKVLDRHGFAISDAHAVQSHPKVAWNGSHYFVVWNDARASTYPQTPVDIYGARVSSAGDVLDPSGIAICAEPGQQSLPEVAAWGGEFFVVWNTLGQLSGSIRGTAVTDDGQVAHPQGIWFSDHFAAGSTALAANRTGYLLAWTHNPYSGRIGCDVRVLFVDPTGEEFDPYEYFLARTTNFITQADVAASLNEFLTVWMDDRGGRGVAQVWGARIGQSGVLDTNGFFIAPMASGRYDHAPAVAACGDAYLVAWVGREMTNSTSTDIYVTRVGHAGRVLDPLGIRVSTRHPGHGRLAWISPPGKGKGRLKLEGDPGVSYVLQTSPDLINWAPLATLPLTNNTGQLEIDLPSQPGAAPSQSYYRAVTVP